MRWNHEDLQWQFDWRGNKLVNLRILVCSRCLDKPFEHWRPIITGQDPVPVIYARPDTYAPTMPLLLTDTNGVQLTDINGVPLMATGGPGYPVLPPNTITDLNQFPLLDKSGDLLYAVPD